MNKIIIIISLLSLTFTQELKVEGDLKVTGNIDAQNNPIKNVGVLQEMTDAVNGNVLQNALRDDGVYEYKMRIVSTVVNNGNNLTGWWWRAENTFNNNEQSLTTYHEEFQSLLNDGWKLDSMVGETISYWIFKRPLEE